MLVSLTVGKVDAGVAVLLTEDKRLIEFPSILLPPSITSGSIVDITVSQNRTAEATSQKSFAALQSRILNTYGLRAPSPPTLRLRNATQTSLVLEWDPIDLATSSLKSLTLFRNGTKAGSIPRPKEMLQTKISGLAVDTDYSFHLVLRTTGGTFSSPVLTVRTHKMTDLSGITVTPGILPPPLRESLERAVERIGAKMADGVRIDTTHFVCTEGRGADWERAAEMNIPIVRPEWLEGCEQEGRIVGVRGYYLDANPKNRQMPPLSGASGGDATRQNSTAEPQVGASTTSLPYRGVAEADQQGASTPEREGYVSGPGNGPGPEVPPTPPPKDQSNESDEGDQQEEDEDESGTETGEPVVREITDNDENNTSLAASESQGRKATVENDETAEGMEDVAL
ncbi:MAG: hypothetical protein Q9227_007736 [Pyrenula ochraceoflavens]